jgi:acetyl-CoA synthetase
MHTPKPLQSLSQEKRLYTPQHPANAHAAIASPAQYQALCQHAQDDEAGFWEERAINLLSWKKPFTQVLDESAAPQYRWFADGYLNASYNCLDRHVEAGNGQRTAIIFEGDDGLVREYSYALLLREVCQLANALKARGLKKGDRVVIYMPMSVQGVVAMQACARLGLTHSVVFGGFSAKSLHERIVDTGAVAVITGDEQVRGGKVMAIKAVVDEALAKGGCEAVGSVIVYQRTGGKVPMQAGRDITWAQATHGQPSVCEPVWVGAEHPLFILYTSGSTGKPKGLVHTTGGYLLWAQQTCQWSFDLDPIAKPDDVFWCTADIGWITGHSYVAYGPLANGSTQLIFEGVPMYPHAGRFWQMIERHRVSVFYTAPTAIRALIKANTENPASHPSQYDLSSLRILGSVGEPINPEAWVWYYEQVGRSRCPVIDTFWQTETGGHIICPLPAATPLVPGSCTLPLPGVRMAVVDEAGGEVQQGTGGNLVMTRPHPAMARTIWGDAQRYAQAYFPPDLRGAYLAGDAAVCDKATGYFTIMGRVDDVVNVSGHRMGTMEIESALVAHPDVAEAAVVSRPDDVTGEAIVAFITLKATRPVDPTATAATAEALRAWVAHEIGAIAKPKDIRFGDNLPKTRSGKIMRRLLRQLARGEAITQDVSTLENPAILDQLKA